MQRILVAFILTLSAACVHRPTITPVVDHRLPAWIDAMSDSCSTVVRVGAVDVRLRAWDGKWTPAQRACCVQHDHRYYDGGSATDRFNADRELQHCIVRSGGGVIGRLESAALGYVMFEAVQQGGGPEQRIPRVSWAWAPTEDPVFAYTDAPREERPQ